MKIALLNPWHDAAENQLVPGIVRAAAAIGHQAVECKTTDDVLNLQPDFVLSMSRTQPKLTDIPTYGLIFDPRHILLERPSYLSGMLSYDGVFTIFDTLRQLLADLMFAARRDAPIEHFYPTAPLVAWDRTVAFDEARLAYFGINWDRRRHGLFALLDQEPWMDIYGPEHGWTHLVGLSYRGKQPFDGISVLERYREAGAGLCLFSDSHVADNIVTSRVFEICAAGAVVIAPTMPWLAQHFGDSILYFDQRRSDHEVHDQIQQHMAWIRAHPEDASALAARSHRIFADSFSLEVLLPNVISLHRRVVSSRRTTTGTAKVSVVVPWSHQSAETLKRSLASVARQSCRPIETIVVVATHADAGRAEHVASELVSSIDRRIVVADTSPGDPVPGSSLVWAGLQACQGEYLTVLPSGDEWMSDHIASLVRALAADGAAGLAFSGSVVHHAEELITRGGHADHRRILPYPFVPSRADVVQEALQVPAASAMFHRSLLDHWILEDPRLATCHDAYLVLSLLASASPVFSYRATTIHHESEEALSRNADPTVADEITRLRLRFVGRAFPPAPRLADFEALQRSVERGETRRQQDVGEIWRHNGVAQYRVPASFEYLVGTEDTWEPVAVRMSRCDVELWGATRPTRDGSLLPLAVEPPVEPWAFGLRWHVELPEDRPYVVRLDCRVDAGTAGFGVLVGERQHVAYRVFVSTHADRIIVDLPISEPRSVTGIVIQGTVASRCVRVLVNDVQVLAATDRFPLAAVKRLLYETEQFRAAQQTIQQELRDENDTLRDRLEATQRAQQAIHAQLAAMRELLAQAETLQASQAAAHDELRQEIERLRAHVQPDRDGADG